MRSATCVRDCVYVLHVYLLVFMHVFVMCALTVSEICVLPAENARNFLPIHAHRDVHRFLPRHASVVYVAPMLLNFNIIPLLVSMAGQR